MKAKNTWSGLTAKQDVEWGKLWSKYVPSMGMANTVGGEILRAMSRIIYRYYNDGDMVGIGYGNQTVNSSDRYLYEEVPGYSTLDGICFEDVYEEIMLRNHRTIFEFLTGEGKHLFEIANTIDSREPSDEDIRREREDYEEDWENEDEF